MALTISADFVVDATTWSDASIASGGCGDDTLKAPGRGSGSSLGAVVCK